MPPKVLFVFDFDWTFIDENSDTVFIERFLPGVVIEQEFKKFACWTHFMVCKLFFRNAVSRP
jgi:hypothetical protein